MIIHSFLYHIRSQQLAPTCVNFQGKHFLYLDLDINLLHILFSVHPAFQADNKHRDPASWGMYSVPTCWALVNPTRASPIVKRMLLLLFIEMELFTNSRNQWFPLEYKTQAYGKWAFRSRIRFRCCLLAEPIPGVRSSDLLSWGLLALRRLQRLIRAFTTTLQN